MRPRRGRREGSRRFRCGTGCAVSGTRPPAAHPPRQRRAPHSGCLLFGYFLLGKQEKVTRSPGMASETRRDAGRLSRNTEAQSKELDPGLRRDDEVGGFRRNDEREPRRWVPAFAGMTRWVELDPSRRRDDEVGDFAATTRECAEG